MEDGYTLFDYEVGLNDIIQIHIKPEVVSGDKKDSVVEETNTYQEASSSGNKQRDKSPEPEATVLSCIIN